MARKNKKKEHYRVGSEKTKNLDSLVITTWRAKAREYHIPSSVLVAECVEIMDEEGLCLESMSHKNQQGYKIIVRERKYVKPGTKHQRDPNRGYHYLSDFEHREYEFILERNGRIEQRFSAEDVSRRVPSQMNAMLSKYSAGLNAPRKA